MQSPLTDVLPPQVRRTVYIVFALVGLALGALQVGFSAAVSETPGWLTVTLAVFPFVSTALGFTAASNTVLGNAVASRPAPPADLAAEPGAVA